MQIKKLTDEEISKRKELRRQIEYRSSEFFDKHGNSHKCLTVTDVMKLLYELDDIKDLVFGNVRYIGTMNGNITF